MAKKKLYISISDKNIIVGVMCFDNKAHMNCAFFDTFHDNGYVIKEITKKEYDEYDGGDELTIEDIKNGNYRRE